MPTWCAGLINAAIAVNGYFDALKLDLYDKNNLQIN